MKTRTTRTLYFYCFCIMVALTASAIAQNLQTLRHPVDSVPTTVSMLLEEAEDADIMKVHVISKTREEWSGYIVVVDSTTLCMLIDTGIFDSESDSLRVFALSDILTVFYSEKVGTFPAFTILVPALSVSIAEASKHDFYNIFIPILTLPVGLLVDYIISLFDVDESWSWVQDEEDILPLRMHALFPNSTPSQLGVETFKNRIVQRPLNTDIPPATDIVEIPKPQLEGLVSQRDAPLLEIITRDGKRKLVYLYTVNDTWLQYVHPETSRSDDEAVLPIHTMALEEVACVRFDEELSIFPYGTLVMSIAAGMTGGLIAASNDLPPGRAFFTAMLLSLPVALVLEKVLYFLDKDDSWEWYPEVDSVEQLQASSLRSRP